MPVPCHKDFCITIAPFSCGANPSTPGGLGWVINTSQTNVNSVATGSAGGGSGNWIVTSGNGDPEGQQCSVFFQSTICSQTVRNLQVDLTYTPNQNTNFNEYIDVNGINVVSIVGNFPPLSGPQTLTTLVPLAIGLNAISIAAYNQDIDRAGDTFSGSFVLSLV